MIIYGFFSSWIFSHQMVFFHSTTFENFSKTSIFHFFWKHEKVQHCNFSCFFFLEYNWIIFNWNERKIWLKYHLSHAFCHLCNPDILWNTSYKKNPFKTKKRKRKEKKENVIFTTFFRLCITLFYRIFFHECVRFFFVNFTNITDWNGKNTLDK